jgi:hypothetical protein
MLYLLPCAADAVCESGAVQLAGLGRVEYCRAGRWGAICLDSSTAPWSEKNAQVVCKQLGRSGALNSVLPNEYVEMFSNNGHFNLIAMHPHERAMINSEGSNSRGVKMKS